MIAQMGTIERDTFLKILKMTDAGVVEAMRKGEDVVIRDVDGLTLVVEKK